MAWTVKIVNTTDTKITVDIHSSQLYPGWNDRCVHWCPKNCDQWSPANYWTGCATQKECGFSGQEVEPNTSKDFQYNRVNAICKAPCTKSVKVTSPVALSASNPITTCGNVVVYVRQDKSGKWKIEYKDWTTEVLQLLEERTRMPLEVRKMCDKFSNSPIQAISVFRTPIEAGINQLLTALTEKQMKKLNYDDLYHTGFIITCEGQLIRLERNQTVSNEIIRHTDMKDLEQRPITLPKTINYSDFIATAMHDDPNFWTYNPIKNNCQIFVLRCLERNNVIISDDLYQFIYQDAAEMLSKNPSLRRFATGVTSIANRVDNLIEKTGIMQRLK
jgi:hypothetical protein